MLWVKSGTTDQAVHFVGPRNSGSLFTVYRKRGVGDWTVMTTPTVAEDDPTNAPGIYSLLMDEDTTITAGKTTEHMLYAITIPSQPGMVPLVVETCLYDALEVNVKKINAASVLGIGSSGNKWRG